VRREVLELAWLLCGALTYRQTARINGALPSCLLISPCKYETSRPTPTINAHRLGIGPFQVFFCPNDCALEQNKTPGLKYQSKGFS